MKFTNLTQAEVTAGDVNLAAGAELDLGALTLSSATVQALANALRNGTLVAPYDDAQAFISYAQLLLSNPELTTPRPFPEVDVRLSKFADRILGLKTVAGSPLILESGSFPNRKKQGFVEQFLCGRESSLAPFGFKAIYGNGDMFFKEEIEANFSNGIPGLLERVADSGVNNSTPSQVGTNHAWKLICHPDHFTTEGRPRSLIVGQNLEPYTHYQIDISLRLHHTSHLGWFDKNVPSPLAAIFALSQQTGPIPYDSGPDQLGSGASPLYLTMRGACLYPEFRVISENMGVWPDDPGATVTWATWKYGDTPRSNRRRSPLRVLYGNLYHDISIEFYLDELRRADGGVGYIKCYFNGEHWFTYRGATMLPKNHRGNLLHVTPRLGFYEVSPPGTSHPHGTLVKNASASCTVERSLLIQEFGVMEAK